MKEGLYQALAPFYDALNGELDYAAWADHMEQCFHQYYPAGVQAVLDLACGTGRMTEELCRRGYDMIGVDSAPEMLAVAHEKAEQAGMADRILYLCQDMCAFELYGTVEAVVCCLDSVNHVTDRQALSRCFHWVHNYLVPGGLFLFDVNTPAKFSRVYGEHDYVLEEDGVLCAWQNVYHPRTHLCDFYISLFEEGEDGRYDRQDVHQQERAYSMRTLRQLLAQNGLEVLALSGDIFGAPATEECERWHFVARAVKED